MDEKQFKEMMEKLEEIRCGIIDVENAQSPKLNDFYNLMNAIRDDFYVRLEARRGWGKNEIKKIYSDAMASVL